MEIFRYLIPACLAILLLWKLNARLELSRAKHPSLSGHAKMSRRLSRLITFFEYGSENYFSSDLAPLSIASRRRMAMDRLRQKFAEMSPISQSFSQSLESSISDVQFTSRYRVPFPYRNLLPKEFRFGAIVEESRGTQLRDLDGNWRYDVSGSYGVNVFGYDFYKECLSEGYSKVAELGPVLGAYHPVIRNNVQALQNISGLDEVSFHMSGTEAVMQAVRLARYHTGKKYLVRLCGSYHGWWDGVQPGVGNRRQINDVYTLADLSQRTLHVLKTRNDIACVLINPLQAMHPNSDAPGDSSLVNSARKAAFDRVVYTQWLGQIREICSTRGIVLIFDEVFTGFRLAYRGAQEYFSVQADMVTYGKTLGGGLPVGVLCGKAALMKRFKDEQPANVSFARGTFNSHPHVMACMSAFLRRIGQPEFQAIYAHADALWNRRIDILNRQLASAELPVRLVNLHSILTVLFDRPSRYNWMLQFYLRAEGLELSWVGSGRMIMSLNYSDDDFAAVASRFQQAAQQMQNDGWWWTAPHLTDKWIKQQMFKDMWIHRFGLRRKIRSTGLVIGVPSAVEEGHRHG